MNSETPITFTPDEFEAAILEAINGEPPARGLHCEPGFITIGIIKDRYDCTNYQAEKVLRDMLKSGKLVRAWVRLTDGWGTVKRVKGYRLVT